MKTIFALAMSLLALVPVRTAQACSMALTGPPQIRLDPEEWVFAGKVTGYVGPFRSAEVEGDYWALEVSISASSYQPTRADVVEVSYLGLAADCSTVGSSWQGLENNHPIGSTVLVVAWPSHQISKGSRPQLEASWAHGAVAFTTVSPEIAIRRVTNYETVRCLDQHAQVEQGYGTRTDIVAVFEYHKELARLARASRRSRFRIFERLTWSPFWLEGMVPEYLGNTPESRELIQKQVSRRRRGA